MNLTRLKQTLFHRRRGAVAMLGVAAMIPLTAMFAANVNSGQMIEERRKTQDAADALALTHGAWTARSLNMLSMNRVTSMQLLTVAAGSEALEGSLQEVEFHAALVAAHITIHGAQHCPPRFVIDAPWTPICVGWHALVGIPALKALMGTSFSISEVPGLDGLLDFDADDLTDEERENMEEAGFDPDDPAIPLDLMGGPAQNGVWDIRRLYDPVHGAETAEKALDAIIGMDEEIIRNFPQTMAEIGENYIRLHDVDDFHFNDPCNGDGVSNCATRSTRNGMALPLEEVPGLSLGSFNPVGGADMDGLTSGVSERARYCAGFYLGTPGGGSFNLMNTTFQARGFPNNRGPVTHGGSRGQPNLKVFINRETEIGRILFEFKDFYKRDNILSHLPRYLGLGLDPFAQWANLKGPQRRTGNNSFTRRFDFKMASICTGMKYGDILPDFLPDLDDLPDWVPFQYMIRFDVMAPLPPLYKLKDVPTLQVPPWVQPDQMPDAFRILALTQSDKNRRLADQVLIEDVDSHFGYGQVGVYNPDDASLYSQNWQFRMMPASRADNARDLAGDLRRQARGSFRDLSQSLNGVSHSSWRRVNAH